MWIGNILKKCFGETERYDWTFQAKEADFEGI